MTSVDDILELFDRWGGERYDENVPQLDHALQTAAHAAAAGASDALVAAALLHDVGTILMLSGEPRGKHERTGPAYLTPLFSEHVTDPIALHVLAKRYLCAVEPTYVSILSAGSVRSLERQGGPMAGEDVTTFEAMPRWRDAVALRRWDDAGKIEGAAVPGLSTYEPLLRRLCSGS